MTVRLLRHAGVILAFGLNPLGVAPAAAGLGGDAASAAADADAMGGRVLSTSLQRYVVQEITTDSGMHVAEYLNNDGTIFAVSWSGPVVPDLQRLLGASFAAYAKAVAALRHPGLERSLRIASPELVIEFGGALRGYRGRAYLPALMPPDTPASELR